MNYLVVLIVNETEHVPEVLEKWESLGVIGITILESTGHGKIKRAGLLESLPLIPSLENLMEMEEVRHRTLFSVVDSEELTVQMEKAAEEVIGKLDDHDTGFFFVVPVLKAVGIQKKIPPQKSDRPE